jgi:hypothetical protein
LIFPDDVVELPVPLPESEDDAVLVIVNDPPDDKHCE